MKNKIGNRLSLMFSMVNENAVYGNKIMKCVHTQRIKGRHKKRKRRKSKRNKEKEREKKVREKYKREKKKAEFSLLISTH